MRAGPWGAEMKDRVQMALEVASPEKPGAFAEYLTNHIEWITGNTLADFDANNMRDALEAYPTEYADLEQKS